MHRVGDGGGRTKTQEALNAAVPSVPSFWKNEYPLPPLLPPPVFFTLTCVCHGCTCVPHPEPTSHLPPHPIPQGHPSAPALSSPSHASNLDDLFHIW